MHGLIMSTAAARKIDLEFYVLDSDYMVLLHIPDSLSIRGTWYHVLLYETYSESCDRLYFVCHVRCTRVLHTECLYLHGVRICIRRHTICPTVLYLYPQS